MNHPVHSIYNFSGLHIWIVPIRIIKVRIALKISFTPTVSMQRRVPVLWRVWK